MNVCGTTPCHDGNDCTIDVCNEGRQLCDFVPVGDGAPCALGLCVGGSCVPTCTNEVCPCTEAGIRAAVTEGGGPFTFDCDGPSTVQTDAEIVIDNDVILDGEGNLTVDGRVRHRVFRVGRVTATFIGMTVTGGYTIDSPGGGIANLEGNLTLERCTVSRNFADIGRFPHAGPQGGGGIYNIGTLTIIESTVSENGVDVGNGPGVLNGAVLWSNEEGGIELIPEVLAGDLTIINSTVSGNMRGRTVGRGISAAAGPVTLSYCTVSDGIENYSEDAEVIITKSLVDGECRGKEPMSGGYNIETPGDTCGFDRLTDRSNVPQAWLGVLRDNGGSTETHALLTTISVAVDVIPANACVDPDGLPLTTDQRGEPRLVGNGCDVGAFELQR